MAIVFKLVRNILVSMVIVHVLIQEFAEGRSITNMVKKTTINKAIIQTIESEDGEIIDCFDIYKQPAFDHPLLHDHTLQMRPSSYPNGMKTDELEIELIQTWHKHGKCPDGTIPIQRAQKNLNFTMLAKNGDDHEFAAVATVADKFYGAIATLNVWKPTLATDFEMSSSQIWVAAGHKNDNTLNTVEAGWIVNPLLYLDNEPRIFLYWTSDNYKSKGCYNLLCPGFMQTNTQFSLGSIIKPVSAYNGEQFDIPVVIFKDENKGDWWVKVNDKLIGYWPSSIFTTLSGGATEIQWGGEIINSHPKGHHTTTQMGSGHFPSEGFKKASFIRNMGILDANKGLRDPENLVPAITNSNCYDVHIANNKQGTYGYHIYFGGPGLSQKCP